MATAYFPILCFSLQTDSTIPQRSQQANSPSLDGQSCAETRFRQSSADAAAATTELRLTSLPDVERFPNLKLSLSNPKTTTIDEIN
ncbi:hypothetical protein J6590_042526 [Homalodisca vitripennis]|nr:hypothetical protein J6590_042526 [Homalodisca vitripennis]